MRALSLSYSDGRQFKRVMRRLWIRRLNCALRNIGIQKNMASEEFCKTPRYSSFIHTLKNAKSIVNRKVLSQLAVLDPSGFTKFVNSFSA